MCLLAGHHRLLQWAGTAAPARGGMGEWEGHYCVSQCRAPRQQQPTARLACVRREWFARMADAARELVSRVLPPHLQGAVTELAPYLVDSFGNATRIDYGTGGMRSCCLARGNVACALVRRMRSGAAGPWGLCTGLVAYMPRVVPAGHETTFCAFLYCLAKLGVLEQRDCQVGQPLGATPGLHCHACDGQVATCSVQLQRATAAAGTLRALKPPAPTPARADPAAHAPCCAALCRPRCAWCSTATCNSCAGCRPLTGEASTRHSAAGRSTARCSAATCLRGCLSHMHCLAGGACALVQQGPQALGTEQSRVEQSSPECKSVVMAILLPCPGTCAAGWSQQGRMACGAWMITSSCPSSGAQPRCAWCSALGGCCGGGERSGGGGADVWCGEGPCGAARAAELAAGPKRLIAGPAAHLDSRSHPCAPVCALCLAAGGPPHHPALQHPQPRGAGAVCG